MISVVPHPSDAVAAAVHALATFPGVRVQAVPAGAGVEARLYLPRNSSVGDEGAGYQRRQRGRAAIYALAALIELTMTPTTWWWTSLYFSIMDPTVDGFQGAVIIDSGFAERDAALTLAQAAVAKLQAVTGP